MTGSNAAAVTTQRFFSRETRIETDIFATPETIWKLLVDGESIPRWTSTIVSIDGKIEPDGRIRLVSALAPQRVFNLRVKSFEPAKLLAWGDRMGNRSFSISELGTRHCRFSMSEKIGGPVFPLFARFIPSFDKSFERFANDLKQEAEKVSDDN